LWISELFTTDINLDWLRRRLPVVPAFLDEFLDIAHFACIVNGAVLLVACFLVPSAFNIIDPIKGPNLETFTIHVIEVSLPVWCVIFGVWRWSIICDRVRIIWRGRSVQDEPPELWDECLDGPAWFRS